MIKQHVHDPGRRNASLPDGELLHIACGMARQDMQGMISARVTSGPSAAPLFSRATPGRQEILEIILHQENFGILAHIVAKDHT